MVKVSHKAANTEGPSAALQEGEYVKLKDLLYMIMLPSGNDAAIAVAEHIGGSVNGFVQLMNDEAKSMGAVNSHFTNPNGLHDPKHYTTSSDLALITREAMKNSLFRKIVGTCLYHVYRSLPMPVNGIPQEDYINHNKLLLPGSPLAYKGINGVKTGFTDEARECLVSSAERNGQNLIAVVMKAENTLVYKDTISLLDYGFKQFTLVKVVEKDVAVGMVIVNNGVSGEVKAVTGEGFHYNVPLSSMASIEKKIQLGTNIDAPVKKGQKIGTMTFMMESKEVGKISLVADQDVARKSLSWLWYPIIIAFLYLYAKYQRWL